MKTWDVFYFEQKLSKLVASKLSIGFQNSKMAIIHRNLATFIRDTFFKVPSARSVFLPLKISKKPLKNFKKNQKIKVENQTP